MATVTVELELSAGVWTDCSGDVLARYPVKWSRGIMDSGPLDLIARPGVLSFALNNGPSNSGGLAGFYSPGHTNARSGFEHGTRARVKIDAGSGVSRMVYRGRLRTISPTPGETGPAATFCVCEDYMAEFSDTYTEELALVESKRADQLIDLLLDKMETAPAAKSLATGRDVYPFAFDNLGAAGSPTLVAIAQAVMQSERGFLYVTGDATTGELFVMESRDTRAKTASSLTLSAGDFRYDAGLTVPSDLSRVFNDVETIVNPRKVDAAATTILVSLATETEIAVGQTVTLLVDYRDPSGSGTTRVGGKDMVTPAANTDYTGNAASGGGGTDLTSDLDLSATEFFGSRAKIIAENTGSQTVYLRGPGSADGPQLRGKGLYVLQPVHSLSQNATSIAKYGRRQIDAPLDMPYQASQAIRQGVADYVAHLFGDVANVPTKATLLTEKPALLQSALPLDIGARVTISEPPSGVSSTEVFVNGIEGTVTAGKSVSLTWTLAPASTTAVLILDDAVAGKLDSNSLGYA